MAFRRLDRVTSILIDVFVRLGKFSILRMSSSIDSLGGIENHLIAVNAAPLALAVSPFAPQKGGLLQGKSENRTSSPMFSQPRSNWLRTTRSNIGGAILVAALSVLFVGDIQAVTPVHEPGPFVERVTPPALCRGRTNRVELFGRELDGALDVWTSLPGIRLKAVPQGASDSQHATFEVDVPANAPLGLYGLRVATRSGLSNVHLFLIDELPIQSRESLPSSASSSLRKVALPAAIFSPCRAVTVDRYEIDVPPGQRITFEVVGNRFGKDYDPLVTIRDARGRIVAERDNDAGLFFDCRFEHTFADGGLYSVEVRDARFDGDPTWQYLLRMGDFPMARVAVPSSVTLGAVSRVQLSPSTGSAMEVTLPAEAPLGWFFQEVRQSPQGLATWIPLHADRLEHALETEPNDARETATPANVPAALHGILNTAGDRDWFQIEMQPGKAILFRSEARALGSPADLELILLDPDGKEVRRNDEVKITEGPESWSVEASLEYSAQKAGRHCLCVRDMTGGGGPAFAYRVEVTASEAKLELSLAVDRVTLPQNTYQPVPLKITRTQFAGPIELELLGAPAGVVLEPTTIPADVSEIVCRLKSDGSTPQGLATLQIVGRWKSAEPSGGPSATAWATTRPLIDQRIKDSDLRLTALRDDQLSPPPSLSNRIALLIIPPSSFDMHLPEATLLVTKYVDGKFPIVTTRSTGFTSPITFTARGGQIGAEAEERSNIFVRLPAATPDQLAVDGLVFNRILTAYGKFRVEVIATASEETRRVTLTRTFEMEVKSAFSPTAEVATVEIDIGGTATFRILANRTPAFDGPVNLTSSTLNGFECPEKIEIPAGQAHVDLLVKAAPKTPPGNTQFRLVARGNVGKYEEEVNGPNLTITVKKPPLEKKP